MSRLPFAVALYDPALGCCPVGARRCRSQAAPPPPEVRARTVRGCRAAFAQRAAALRMRGAGPISMLLC